MFSVRYLSTPAINMAKKGAKKAAAAASKAMKSKNAYEELIASD